MCIRDRSTSYAELYQAVPMGGYVLVTLNSRYTRSELEAACLDCSPQVLFTDRTEAEVGQLAPRILPMDERLDELLEGVPNARTCAVDEADDAVIFYTGGTTDRAKGVVLSHRAKLADAMSLIVSVDLTGEDRWLVMSPMFHAAGSFNILPCVWVGASQFFLPRFDAEAALRAIEKYLSLIHILPTFVRLSRDLPKLASLKVDKTRLRSEAWLPSPVYWRPARGEPLCLLTEAGRQDLVDRLR